LSTSDLGLYLISVYYQFESYAVYIHNIQVGICLQVFADLGDVHIHASGIEIAVVLPDSFNASQCAPAHHWAFRTTFSAVLLFGGEFDLPFGGFE
jgi:hypothetical protein